MLCCVVYRLFVLVCLAAALQIFHSPEEFARGVQSQLQQAQDVLFSASRKPTWLTWTVPPRAIRRWPQKLANLSQPLHVIEVCKSEISPVFLVPLPPRRSPPKPKLMPSTCILPPTKSAAITVFAASNIDGSVAFRVRSPTPLPALDPSAAAAPGTSLDGSSLDEAGASMLGCIEKNHGPSYSNCHLKSPHWGRVFTAFDHSACQWQGKGLGPEATTWVDQVDCRTPEGAQELALSGNWTDPIVEIQQIGGNNVSVYHFPPDVPVIFWNRTEGPYLKNQYHGTARLLVLTDILTQAGLLQGRPDGESFKSEEQAARQSFNRNSQIVVFDNHEQYRPRFSSLVSAMSQRPFLYNEPPPQQQRAAFAVCASHGVVAKDPTLEGLDPVNNRSIEAANLVYKKVTSGGVYSVAYRRFVYQIMKQLKINDHDTFAPRILQHFKPVRPRIVFLLRKGGGGSGRVIANEAELRARLVPPPGFPEIEYIHFEGQSFDNQVAMLLNATVMIGVHGAGLMNDLYVAEGGTVIELYPSSWAPWRRVQMYANNAVLTQKHYIRLYYQQPDLDENGRQLTNNEVRDWNPYLNVTEVQELLDLACGQGVNAELVPEILVDPMTDSNATEEDLAGDGGSDPDSEPTLDSKSGLIMVERDVTSRKFEARRLSP